MSAKSTKYNWLSSAENISVLVENDALTSPAIIESSA